MLSSLGNHVLFVVTSVGRLGTLLVLVQVCVGMRELITVTAVDPYTVPFVLIVAQ